MFTRDYSTLTTTWDAVLSSQLTAADNDAHHNTALQVLEKWLPRIEDGNPHLMTVLDVGCGKGWLEGYFAQRKGWEWHGVEFGPAQPGMPTVHQADFHFLNLPRTFDLVFARHVVEHSPMPLLAVTKLAEFTAPGGWCIIVTPLPPYTCTEADHYSVMGRAMWCNLFTRAGLVVEDREEAQALDGSIEQRFLLRRKAVTP